MQHRWGGGAHSRERAIGVAVRTPALNPSRALSRFCPLYTKLRWDRWLTDQNAVATVVRGRDQPTGPEAQAAALRCGATQRAKVRLTAASAAGNPLQSPVGAP